MLQSPSPWSEIHTKTTTIEEEKRKVGKTSRSTIIGSTILWGAVVAKQSNSA
jgi:hypothetical protein